MRRSACESDSHDITGAEGESLLAAIRWAVKARAEGRIRSDEVITLFNDNEPVVAKARERRPWGKHSEMWGRLHDELADLRRTGPAYVSHISRGVNLADEVVSRAVLARREERRLREGRATPPSGSE